MLTIKDHEVLSAVFVYDSKMRKSLDDVETANLKEKKTYIFGSSSAKTKQKSNFKNFCIIVVVVDIYHPDMMEVHSSVMTFQKKRN